MSDFKDAAYTQVKGHLEQDGRKLQEPTFSGKWSESLSATAADGAQRQLWQVNDVPANRCVGWCWGKQACTLCGLVKIAAFCATLAGGSSASMSFMRPR